MRCLRSGAVARVRGHRTTLATQPSRSVSLLSKLRQPWGNRPGCFGVPGLHRAEDWDTLAKQCINDCLSLADSIRAEARSPTPIILQHFDDMSDKLCSVLDVAELCRNVHPDPEFVRAADEAYNEVCLLTQQLNADETIYEPLNILHDRHHKGASSASSSPGGVQLSEEELILVKSLKEDFETGGIQLDRDSKKRLISVQQELNTLSSQFLSADDTAAGSTLKLEEKKLRSLPNDVRRQLGVRQANRSGQEENDVVEIPLSSSSQVLLLRWMRESAVREQIFRSMHRCDDAKSAVLDGILSKRHEMARMLGRSSYADMMFSGRLASSPSAVVDFLHELSARFAPLAERELTSLGRAKALAEPGTVVGDSVHAPVHGWDHKFYIGRIKAERYNLAAAGLSRYLSLAGCLAALAGITRDVLGVVLEAADEDGMAERWHPDVRKLRVVDEAGGHLLGHIFLDLHPRPDKYVHAAHFSIRLGRQPSGGMPYQTPVVALVCNFGGTAATPDTPRLLSVSEYETLFHEFGHSLHSVLSRTRFQHLSGTRVATDLVEVPSHVFEHFAWDARVLARYARHCDSGDAMPTRTIANLCQSRAGFVATDVQNQALFSAMDLHFHGEAPPVGHTTASFARLQRDLTVVPPDDGISTPASFHHFITYGAGYYSYVFARVLSAQIWKQLFEHDSFSRSGGLKLRYGLLQQGASKNASKLMSDLIDGDITCDAFLEYSDLSRVMKSEGSAPLHLPLSSKLTSRRR